MRRIVEGLDRITFNPEVMGGKPCIRGMRVTVGMVVRAIAGGLSVDELLGYYPYLEREDVEITEHQEAIEAGALLVVDEYRYKLRLLPI